MSLRRVVPVGLAGIVLAGAGVSVARYELPARTTVLGREITPAGTQTEVGSFPVNMILSPDGKYVIVTNSGFRQQLSVLDSTTGKLVYSLAFQGREAGKPRSLYFGLAATPLPGGMARLAVSRGSQDKVSFYKLASDGTLAPDGEIALPAANNPIHVPYHVAGVAWNADGSKLYAVANQSHAFNGFKGSLFTLDVASGSVLANQTVGGFPLAVMATPTGNLYVANEGGSDVSCFDPSGQPSQVHTGEGPAYLSTNHAGSKLFVSNSNSDTVSFVDLPSGHVSKTVLLRPERLKGIGGATPLGSAVSPDDQTLYVAMADLCAVAVVDIPSGRLRGYLPAGWYPTAVAVSPDGQRLFVSNAKGTQTANPNAKAVRDWGTYGPNILEGTVSMIADPTSAANLQEGTVQVLANNRADKDWVRQESRAFLNPGIQHVVYIIKENRTYDQVMGDEQKGNGDASLTLFGKDVTPNQHALAERFGLFDNFYVCAEVSADGWNWSTSGMANGYTARNVPYNYSGRGRDYDFEGTNNGSPVSLKGIRDVATAQGGYVWDAFLKKGLSVRNYGMFDNDGVATKDPDGHPIAEENQPNKPALVGRTCTDYRIFDLSYADSEAWVKLGLKPTPRQMVAYGSHRDPSRVTVWLREFNDYVRNQNLPALTLMRLPRNHTSGTAEGLSTPRAMVADNDYAVGQIVDTISHSPYWKSTAIFILEDDAQSGIDHVDSHRSPVLVISPYLTRGTAVDSFYNTDSVLRTMELLFDIPPHNEYLATAKAMNLFGKSADNGEPYSAIMPDTKILSEVNGSRDFGSVRSGELFANRENEDSEADMELNAILWKSIKGAKTPLPKTPGVMWGSKPQ